MIRRFQYRYRLSPIYPFIRPVKFIGDYLSWRIGRQGPRIPHLVKQRLIKEYAWRYNLLTFVETGTFLGDMVFAMRHTFKRIISIEIGEDYYRSAVRQFARSPHIQFVLGDSGKVMPGILASIQEPCLFWVDAHYYGPSMTARGELETPIMLELRSILEDTLRATVNHQDVILIDDANWYIGQGDYPTLDTVTRYIVDRRPNWRVVIQNNVICAYPLSAL
jgi:hypothetical protein